MDALSINKFISEYRVKTPKGDVLASDQLYGSNEGMLPQSLRSAIKGTGSPWIRIDFTDVYTMDVPFVKEILMPIRNFCAECGKSLVLTNVNTRICSTIEAALLLHKKETDKAVSILATIDNEAIALGLVPPIIQDTFRIMQQFGGILTTHDL